MSKKLIVKIRGGIHVIPLEEIIYMEKDLRRIIIHKEDESVGFYGQFKDVVPYLDDRFLFCHRSYIINMDEIVVMDCGGIYVTGNKSIFFGRDTYRKAKKIFVGYLKKKFGRIK